MMSIIRRVREDNNPNLAYRILVTLLDRRNRTHRNIHEQLRATFGEGVFTAIIETDTKLRESPLVGQPITTYRPNSRGSNAISYSSPGVDRVCQKRKSTTGLISCLKT